MTNMNTFAKQMMQTLNGKLIFMNSSELDEFKQRIEQIDRKFDRLETLRSIDGDLSTNPSLQQLHEIDQSVGKLRQIYTRSFWIVVVASLGLTSLNLLGSRHSFCSVRASGNVPYSDVDSVRVDDVR